jgi:hypothetical protein
MKCFSGGRRFAMFRFHVVIRPLSVFIMCSFCDGQVIAELLATQSLEDPRSDPVYVVGRKKSIDQCINKASLRASTFDQQSISSVSESIKPD